MNNTTNQRRRRRTSKLRVVRYIFQFLFLFGMLGVVGMAAATLYQVTRRLPTIEELGLSAAATRIYSDDGVLLARIYRENRDYVHLKDIPRSLQDATVAIEDYRFYNHAGLDVRGIGRALVSNVRGGRLGQGGSTITQQLARNAYGLGREKTLNRKLQEAVVAVRLERKYSKQEILEGYLNEIYYGAKAYGVQAAAMQYFGKPVGKLTVAESALLAGLPQRPTEFNPYKNKAAARNRRNVVLNRMAELGYITPAQAAAGRKEPIRLAYQSPDKANDWKAPYFVDFVIRELEERYRPEQVYRGGLVVRTTLHFGMQQAAEEAVHSGLARAIRAGLVQNKIQAAMTSVDPHNGYVRAMVGGKNWDKSQFNRALNNKRQPGSTFKTFVYTAALNNGWNQWRTVNDTRKSWRQANGKWWTPGNYDGRFRGRISLRTAVANSVNLVAIKTAEAVGIRQCIDVARKLGLKGDLPPFLATSIGAGGASTLEMASAYGAYAVKGMYVPVNPIVTVKDRDGNVLEQATPQATQAIRRQVAQEMADMLRAVVTEGTGRVVGVVPNSYGKTGTTQDDRDAWFVGFTPQLSTAVWIGNDDYSPMHHAYGGKACGPIWVTYMEKALRLNPKSRPDYTQIPGVKTQQKDAPATDILQDAPTDAEGRVSLKICNESGMIATSRCPRWRTRRFEPGEAPTASCGVHVGEPLSPAGTGERRTRRTAEVEPVALEATEAPFELEPEATAATFTPVRAVRAAREPAARTETVVLCADTGVRANAYCPRAVTRRASSSTPEGSCDVHGPGNPG